MLWHGVESAWVEGVTSQDASDGEESAFESAIFFDGLVCISATSGAVTTIRP